MYNTPCEPTTCSLRQDKQASQQSLGNLEGTEPTADAGPPTPCGDAITPAPTWVVIRLPSLFEEGGWLGAKRRGQGRGNRAKGPQMRHVVFGGPGKPAASRYALWHPSCCRPASCLVRWRLSHRRASVQMDRLPLYSSVHPEEAVRENAPDVREPTLHMPVPDEPKAWSRRMPPGTATHGRLDTPGRRGLWRCVAGILPANRGRSPP